MIEPGQGSPLRRPTIALARQRKEERPPIFDERNRKIWEAVRRLLIYLLRELDTWYGWNTFERHP